MSTPGSSITESAAPVRDFLALLRELKAYIDAHSGTGADQTARAAAAAAQGTADAALPKAGGTMTGPLVLSGSPTTDLQAATRRYVLDVRDALVGAAPGTLDTLKEIADQLASDESAVGALTQALATLQGLFEAGKLKLSALPAVVARGHSGRDSFAGKQDGPLTTTDTGEAYATTGSGTFGRFGGFMTTSYAGNAPLVAYAQVQADADVRRMFADLQFAGGTTGGAAALIAWEGPLAGTSVPANSDSHVVFTPTGWTWQIVRVVSGNPVFTTIGTGNWASGVPNDTTRRYEWFAGNGWGEVFGPDGNTYRVFDSRIGEHPGRYAVVEDFRTAPTDRFAKYVAWGWDPSLNARFGPNLGSVATKTALATTDGNVAALAATVAGLPVYRGAWAASTAYRAGQLVTNPAGQVVAAKTDFTSGASYAKANWTDADIDALRGQWAANTDYLAGEVVIQGGLFYQALVDFTSGATFNASNWTLLAGTATDQTARDAAAALAQIRVVGNVASRAEAPGHATGTSTNTDTGHNSRVSHKAAVALDDFDIEVANIGAQADGSNVITVSGAVEYPSGTYTLLTFDGGNPSKVLAAGGRAFSDAVGVPIPANTQFWTKWFVEARDATGALISSGTWRLGKIPNATIGEGTSQSNGETDKRTAAVSGTTGRMYQPVAIRARGVLPLTPRVFSLGDSINYGSNSAGQGTSPDGGYTEILFAGLLPFQRAAIHGETMRNVALNQPYWRKRWLLSRGCTHMFCTLGINDITGSRTLAQLQADALVVWARGKAAGMRVFQATLTPVSTSSNNFQTLAGQTTSSTNQVRLDFNAWVRAGAPISAGAAVAPGASGATLAGAAGHPLAASTAVGAPATMALGYVEVADTVESSRDSGLWKVNGSSNYYTSDGTHPRDNAYADMAVALAAVRAGLVVS